MILDAHTHLLDRGHWPREWWRWVAEDWARRADGRSASDIVDRIEEGLIDPDGMRMVASMDEAGVDACVVLPIDWGPDFTGTAPPTEVVAHALRMSAAHPGRIVAFGGIDPRRPGAPDSVAGWFESGAQGLKLYPSCGWHPASEEAAAVYAVCNAQRRPVLFHTGDPLPLLDRTYSNPALLRSVAESFPDMPVWLGHAGAHRWWREAFELAMEFPNVRLELSVWIWSDTSEADKEVFVSHLVEALRNGCGPQLLFGSDNVSGTRERKPGFLKSVVGFYRELPDRLAERDVVLTQEELDGILGRNTLRDLGLGSAVRSRDE